MDEKEDWTDWTLARARESGKMDKFLDDLRENGNVRQACEEAGLSRSTAYFWRNKFATFRKEWDDALEDACDLLEAEARKRGLADSDRLLMFLLKAHRSEVYGDKVQHDHQGLTVVIDV